MQTYGVGFDHVLKYIRYASIIQKTKKKYFVARLFKNKYVHRISNSHTDSRRLVLMKLDIMKIDHASIMATEMVATKGFDGRQNECKRKLPTTFLELFEFYI